MILLGLLVPRNGPPPPPWVFLLVPLVFFAGTWLTNRLLGIPALYEAFPADPADPIEANLGWLQVEFGALRGHTPMSVKAGRRCLHLKQPFPFQPAWWQGPASIPWTEIRLEKVASDRGWAFMSAAEFRLGAEGRRIRLRGRAARILQAKVQEKQGTGPGAASSAPGTGPIRPR